MYETYFHLKQRPFTAAARVDRYFPAAAIEAARQTLARCIERAEGAGMLVGPPGSGKTLLCQLLAEQFRGAFEIALLSNGHLGTRRELLQAILFEQGLPYRNMDEGELRLTLVDHLSDDRSGRGGLLLILDEAHTFPVRLLEEARLITNLVHHGQPRVRLVLSGGPVLEERFASPRLAAFSQRVASRCYLEPWNAAETRQFVVNQLAAVGGDAQGMVTSDALDAIYRATDGIPRLVNQLCDHALILAFADDRRQLNASGIEQAWADLQQLPTPWSDGPPARQAAGAAAADLIEFGDLDEDEAAGGLEFETPQRADERPVVLLDEIEGHLLTMHERIESEAAIGPYLPAKSRRAANPLDERFDDEEVIVDRYATFEMSRIFRHGSVQSREGELLCALLQPHIAQRAAPQLSLVEAPPADEVDRALSSASESTLVLAEHFSARSVEACAAVPAFEVGWATAANLGRWDGVHNPAESQDGLGKPSDGETSESRRAIEAAADATPPSAPSDDDLQEELIIVEEDPPVVPPPRIRGIPQARRQEYRQLFSMLRRGSSR